jgi:hypothetical protein
MTIASADMVLAADASSADHAASVRGASASVRPAAKSYRVSAAAVTAVAPRRCVTIACPGYVIVGIAY